MTKDAKNLSQIRSALRIFKTAHTITKKADSTEYTFLFLFFDAAIIFNPSTLSKLERLYENKKFTALKASHSKSLLFLYIFFYTQQLGE